MNLGIIAFFRSPFVLWCMTLCVLMLDVLTPVRYAGWVFYVVPLFLSASLTRRHVIALAAGISLFLIVGMFFSPGFIIPQTISVINRITGITMVWLVVFLIFKRISATEELVRAHELLERRVVERTKDLELSNQSLEKMLESRAMEMEKMHMLLFDRELKITEFTERAAPRAKRSAEPS